MFVISNSRATQEHTLYHNRSPQSGLSESACRFDGGRLSFDGGALLLRSVGRHAGLTRRLAACFADHRNPSCCWHSLQRLLAQRLFGLALGYEDINDHDRLREDNLLALAGSSTLDRLELGTAEQAGQDRYKRIVADPQQLDALLVELFLDNFAEAPEEIERIAGQMRQRWPRVRGTGASAATS